MRQARQPAVPAWLISPSNLESRSSTCMSTLNGLPLLSGPLPTSSTDRTQTACRKCNKEFVLFFTRSTRCNHCGQYLYTANRFIPDFDFQATCIAKAAQITMPLCPAVAPPLVMTKSMYVLSASICLIVRPLPLTICPSLISYIQ